MSNLKKRSNKLLWISLLLFGIGYLTIIGYYWLFGGYFGNSHFTISIFVGLQTWSVLLFCALNIIIATMLIVYIATQAKIRNFLWCFLMYLFVVAYVGLSLAAKIPDNTISTDIHQFFSKSLFVIITLITILTIFITNNKLTKVLAISIAIYGIFFIICYVLKAGFFMDGILWHESAFIFVFFALTISSNRLHP